MAKQRAYHKLDGWRGFWMPAGALVGASDTGTWSDSPCPTPRVRAELSRFTREVLRPLGIKARRRMGTSSNVFCGKRYVCVSQADYDRAIEPARAWLAANRATTQYLHDCEDNHGHAQINADGSRKTE